MTKVVNRTPMYLTSIVQGNSSNIWPRALEWYLWKKESYFLKHNQDHAKEERITKPFLGGSYSMFNIFLKPLSYKKRHEHDTSRSME